MSASSADIKVLNSLIEGLIDCADGYREAAFQVTDPRYSQWFERRASERLALAETFKLEVSGRGGRAEDNSSILSKAQRAFSGFAQAVLGNQQSVFVTVRASEGRLKASFETALADPSLSDATREIIASGLEQIREAENDLVALSDYLSPAPDHPADA